MKDVQFLVAGKYAESMEIPSNVRLLGNITDKAYMAKLYAMADVTLLTSKRETFSMVCAESLCCGTPVVGFKAGAPEMISLPEFSTFCNYGDTDELEVMLSDWLNRAKNTKISENAHNIYRNQKMINDYIKVYESMCLGNRKALEK